ncbi:MAG: AtpZ/AtpI family protein [Actinomycetota bacterium]|nr:AtpZ/AtpI family protein [Actinomycetota bacterium]
MSQQDPPSDTQRSGPQGDPWHAFGYVVSGVAVYGLVGWGVDQWLGTSFLVAVGILSGAVLGIYLTISRFDALPRTPRNTEHEQTDQHPDQHPDPT